MMNKTVLYAVIPTFFAMQAVAQSSISTLPTANVSPRETVVEAQNLAQPAQVVQSAPGTISQPTQVVNVQSNAPVSTPVTVVEESPLRESKADAIRRQRMDIETQTEQKIVEKLETERIRAERERAEKLSQALDGGVSEAPYRDKTPEVNHQAPPQIVYVKEPTTVVVADSKPEVVKPSTNRFSVSALGGIGDYPSLRNVKGIYAAGVVLGLEFQDPFIVEGGIMYSSFDVQPVDQFNPYVNTGYYPVIKAMDQTNYFGGLKYLLLEGQVRPTVGALVSYTRRVYKDKQYYYPGPEITSNAFDGGISTGLDVVLSKNFSASLDMRYLFNLSYRIDGAPQSSIINPGQFNRPVEEFSYYHVTVGARFTF